jgi:fused signal recognition particle receptor
MNELAKIRRVLAKQNPEAPHETLLVLDATMGQNALQQARIFNETAPLSAVILTKLDGTAKGGIVFAIADALKLPLRFIGVGEQQDDLQTFSAANFVDALLGTTGADAE